MTAYNSNKKKIKLKLLSDFIREMPELAKLLIILIIIFKPFNHIDKLKV